MSVLMASTPYVSSCHMYLVNRSLLTGRPECGYCLEECGVHAISVADEKVNEYKKLGYVMENKEE